MPRSSASSERSGVDYLRETNPGPDLAPEVGACQEPSAEQHQPEHRAGADAEVGPVDSAGAFADRPIATVLLRPQTASYASPESVSQRPFSLG